MTLIRSLFDFFHSFDYLLPDLLLFVRFSQGRNTSKLTIIKTLFVHNSEIKLKKKTKSREENFETKPSFESPNMMPWIDRKGYCNNC